MVKLALASFSLAVILCLVAIFVPSLLPSQILFGNQSSRFIYCLLIGFLFAIFVFTLYPAEYSLDLGKIFQQLALILVGPAALWIGLTYLFWWTLKQLDAPPIKIVRPKPEGEPLLYNAVTIKNWKPKQPLYYKLEKPDGDMNKTLDGVAIQFDEIGYDAEIVFSGEGGKEKTRYIVRFDRELSDFELKVKE